MRRDGTAESGFGETPTVTVGLPVFDGLEYLDEAVASVLAQTFTDFELLIADNVSTDGTTQRCLEWAARDPRVRVLTSDVNRGAAWNWNRLVDDARGRYFRRAAYDDILEPRLLESSVRCLEQSGADVVGCYPLTLEVDAENVPIGVMSGGLDLELPEPHARARGPLTHLDRRPVLYGLFRTDVLRASPRQGWYPRSDETLIVDLALRGKIVLIPEPLFRRRIHEKASFAAHPSAADMQRFYDPSRVGRHQFPVWSMFLDHIRVVTRSPISFTERLRTLGLLFVEWRWYRSMLGEAKARILAPFRRR